ncbi:MAG: hypothetical protein A2Y17_02710 [Clostridiales bacterium GWF2_38_85]|nr:MAG: hypothetical protein A2Y17_02710 [Clostridiales bacterium GWF2_38_85]
MKIGLISDSLRLDFKSSVEKAASLGVTGIQKYLVNGEFDPYNMTKAKIVEVKNIMNSTGLVFSAICGDFGIDFDNVEQKEFIITKSKKILDIAKELDCNIVTTHIGHIEDDESKRMELLRATASELAVYADSIGSYFAAETGTEKAPVLKKFLDSLGAKGLRINYDPANLVMVAGDDPVKGVHILKDYIVHTHAKDGIKTGDKTFLEVPLGTGGVDFDEYLKALNTIGYTGYLTIEREVGETPAADIKLAFDFLIEKLTKLNISYEK